MQIGSDVQLITDSTFPQIFNPQNLRGPIYKHLERESFTFVLLPINPVVPFQLWCHQPTCQLTELLKHMSSYLESAHQLPAFLYLSITGYNQGISSKLGTS